MAFRIPLLILVLGLAGCGGDDPPSAEPRPAEATEWANPSGERKPRKGVVAITADPSGKPAFEQRAVEARAGRVKLELTNPSSTSHALCVEAERQGALGCTGVFRGGTAELNLRLEPGTYTFYCSVGDHRQAGMTGTLRVR